MTLEQIDSYLIASRDYLTKASYTLSGLSACCTGSPVSFRRAAEEQNSRLWAEQKYLEGLVWQSRYNRQEGLGFPPLVAAIIAGGMFASWLGTQVYTHYTASKTASEYNDCFNRVFKQYKNANYDDTKASEQASLYCKGTPTPNGKESIIGVVKLAVYASIGIAALYFITKLIKD